MKKYNILILLLVLASFSALGQFSIGLRGGYGIHGIYFEPEALNKYQKGYELPNAGFVMIYNNENNAGLQMEINYAQKGWMEKVDEISGSYFKRTINYVEVPVFSHKELGRKAVRVVINAGPYVAYKLSESIQSDSFDVIFNGHKYDQYHQKIRDLDFGIKVGGGLRYNMGKRLSVYAEFRYAIHLAGGQNIFKGQPNKIQASRLKEIGGGIGIVWNIFEQKKEVIKDGYVPKENMIENPKE